MSDLDPTELAAALGRIPLFREVQRLLVAQAGPVNWEIAREIARAVAEAGGPGAAPAVADRSGMAETCRLAEIRIVEATGLEHPAPVTAVEVIGRGAWADVNLAAIRPLVDRLALRLRGQLQEGTPPVAPLQSFLDTLGALLLGIEVGFLVGYLSRRVLGQYDLCLPRGQAGKLLFVHPNLAELERELEVDTRQFRMWVSLHEAAHHVQFTSVPWTRTHFVRLVERFIDAAEIDPAGLAGHMQSLGDPERISHLIQHPEQLLPLLMTPAQKAATQEIQAAMSVFEGFAEWTVREVGATMLPDFEKIREGIARRRAERSSVERLLEVLLGIDLKLEQYRAGERFVGEVAAAGHVARLWESPANLPTLEEVQEPARWLARVVFS